MYEISCFCLGAQKCRVHDRATCERPNELLQLAYALMVVLSTITFTALSGGVGFESEGMPLLHLWWLLGCKWRAVEFFSRICPQSKKMGFAALREQPEVLDWMEKREFGFLSGEYIWRNCKIRAGFFLGNETPFRKYFALWLLSQ